MMGEGGVNLLRIWRNTAEKAMVMAVLSCVQGERQGLGCQRGLHESSWHVWGLVIKGAWYSR